jgi:hypothetical protein
LTFSLGEVYHLFFTCPDAFLLTDTVILFSLMFSLGEVYHLFFTCPDALVLADTFERCPLAKTSEDWEKLLPWNIFTA